MHYRHFSLAALIALGAATPAFATAAAAAPAAKPAAKAPGAPAPAQTRANLVKVTDATFKAIDINGDGVLDANELAAAEGKVQQQRIAAIRQRIDGEFTKLDTNKDGSLSKAEFMAAAPTASSAKPNGAAVVSQLDKNKDGKVSVDEFRAPRLAMFDRFDTNHDGTISDAERAAAQAAANRR